MDYTYEFIDVDAYSDAPDDLPWAIMLSFVMMTKVKVLSGLVELSYFAGREGDDEFAWWEEGEYALIKAFNFKEGARLHWFTRAFEAMRDAFEGGRAQRLIDQSVGKPADGVMEIARARARACTATKSPIGLKRRHRR